ncbi:MAG TPA: GlsB/YeaQ/YmgE family stress response membrane protein [Desulfosporosinus sp.]
MLWLLIIGIIVGLIAGKIVKGGGFGLNGNLVVGVIGSFIGGYSSEILGFSAPGTISGIITALIGAVVLLWIIHYLYYLAKLYICNMIKLS